jgi:pyruvate/2-oxoglutarate dehydrogenase complex dihydrolipoamide dehydrogenase (E3) component
LLEFPIPNNAVASKYFRYWEGNHENAQWLKEQGVDLVLGEGKLTGKDEVIVNEKKYSAKKIVLATGSKPRRLKIPGVELGWQIHSPG